MLSKSKQRLIERLKRPRGRAKEGLALVEGPRVALEALRTDTPVRWMLLGERFAHTEAGQGLCSAAAARHVKIDLLSDELVVGSGATESPQPVLLITDAPISAAPASSGRYLFLDGLQDPGNVGTLIRSAWCFGLSGVVLGAGTADPWSPKALRASAGGAFHLSLHRGTADEIVEAWGMPLIFGSGGLGSAEGAASELPTNWVLAVGNEGAGVSSAVRAKGKGVSIAMIPGADSLNAAVAGSILMYVLSQRGTTS